MITGMHAMFYSADPAATRAFLRDKLGFPASDVGDGWLIFDLPAADLGCHPAEPEHGAPANTHGLMRSGGKVAKWASGNGCVATVHTERLFRFTPSHGTDEARWSFGRVGTSKTRSLFPERPARNFRVLLPCPA